MINRLCRDERLDLFEELQKELQTAENSLDKLNTEVSCLFVRYICLLVCCLEEGVAQRGAECVCSEDRTRRDARQGNF